MPEEPDAWRRTLLFGVLEAAILSCVALYNGYPTLITDSGGYLRSGAFDIALFPFRAPGYGSFTRWTSFGLSAWFTIAAQAILVVYVLHKTFAHLIGGNRKYVDRCLLLGVCVLSVLTSLPWFTSQIMPDIFAGVLFLSAYLLAFADELPIRQRIVLALLVMISVAEHSSLFPITGLFLVTLALLLPVNRRLGGFRPKQFLAFVAWMLVPILAAGLWTARQNQKMGLGFTLSASKNTFLLSTLFSNGLAMDFLRSNCPAHSFISCRYLSNPPRDSQDFLWRHPLVHELAGHDDEMATILHGAILANPRRFIVSSLQQAALQLVVLRTGESMQIDLHDDFVVLSDILVALPRDLHTFMLSRQFNNRLVRVTDAIAPVHTAIFWMSVAGCLLFAWTRRFVRVNQFLIAVIAFLVCNAAVCGATSAVSNRYQSRVEWLIPLCLITYVCCLVNERNSGPASPAGV